MTARELRIGAVILCVLVSGCLKVERIPAEELDNRPKGPLPLEVIAEAEEDVRKVVRQIHRSGTTEVVDKGRFGDDVRVWAKLVSEERDLRDRFTGEEYRCSTVAVRYRFDYNSATFDPVLGRSYVSNRDAYAREDRICTYLQSGHEIYDAGQPVLISE